MRKQERLWDVLQADVLPQHPKRASPAHNPNPIIIMVNFIPEGYFSELTTIHLMPRFASTSRWLLRSVEAMNDYLTQRTFYGKVSFNETRKG